MNLYESAENYLEAILILSKRKPDVRSIDIATHLDFSKPSVSVAMKKLRESAYITMSSDGYIKLTDKGLDIAETVYERHRFFSNFLEALGVDSETATKDACKLEHVISAESFDKLKQFVEGCKMFNDMRTAP